jgi:TRAP-type C4-dicarboxylate transport system permease small subunit
MQWSDAVKPPTARMLRQFAALCLVVFVGFAAWRAARGQVDGWTWGVGLAGAAVGALGLARPAAIRWVYTGWMVVAFPIGWAISRLMLIAIFYFLFTPVALVFRLIRRDALRLRAPAATERSLWAPKRIGDRPADYFRQF